MKDCEKIDIIGYMEGIDPDGKNASHIVECPKCRQQLRQYQFIMKFLAEAGKQGCLKKKELMLEFLGEDGPDPQHLADCPECQQAIARLEAELEALDCRPLREMEPLPPALNAKVNELKRRHQRARVDKVLDLQGIKDSREREKAARQLMEDSTEDLPKAAFPDDLAGEDEDDGDR